ncbi:MAG TPA: potassium-transporting ATPase subunit B, partial [Firmicutes bacterium]|nr:potassium-transporting ATPase subunit B [Bacillota bacterium]
MSSGRDINQRALIMQAIKEAFTKLHPRVQVRNPVMFVVTIGAIITTVLLGRQLMQGQMTGVVFLAQLALWLWFTV